MISNTHLSNSNLPMFPGSCNLPCTSTLLFLLVVADGVGDVGVRSSSIRVRRHLRVTLLALAKGHSLLPARQAAVTCRKTNNAMAMAQKC